MQELEYPTLGQLRELRDAFRALSRDPHYRPAVIGVRLPKVKVLNGEAGVGDKIAYAVRSGCTVHMHIAEVTAITPDGKLRVRVTLSSDSFRTDRIATVERTGRVIRI